MNICKNDIVVSVICLTYNHEKYIKQCLNGFVSQQTNFKFEVLVHDDASNDHTADIIKEYEKKYPEIIRPYYQKENVHSKHISIIKTFLIPLVRGKYIALCEGDDFWCDINKLQKQVDILENHPDCHCCVHRVRNIYEDGSPMKTIRPSMSMNSQIIQPERFLVLSNDYYAFQTSSYLFLTADYLPYISNTPDFRKLSPVGDMPLLSYLATRGNAYFIDEILSCYRVMANGSWSMRNFGTKEKRINILKKIGDYLLSFDEFTKYKFHNVLVPIQSHYICGANILAGDYLACCTPEHKAWFLQQTIRCRTSIRVHSWYQWLSQFIKKHLKFHNAKN